MKKFLTGLFLLPAITGILFAAQMDPQLSRSLSSASSSDRISAIVFLRRTADISMMPQEAAVKVQMLKSISQRSQKDLVEFLVRRRTGKRVRAFNSLWSLNAVAVSADPKTIKELASRSDVEKVVLNRKFSLPKEPAELFPAASRTSSVTIEPNLVQIKADRVWATYGNKGLGVKVGIADTGCMLDHPDLSARILMSATFDELGSKTSDTVVDTNGHGTHVAGIVAGGNASGAYIGVAPLSTLLCAKVFDDTSPNPIATYAQVAAGVDWLISNEAKIVNLSLGGVEGDADSFWKTQVDRWTSLGIVVVGAIGNHLVGVAPPSSTRSPGNVPNAIGVGAIDSSDTVTIFSARGPIVWDTTTYLKPDICAPGKDIYSTYILYEGAYYRAMPGTSMASPHVAGVAALMLAANSTVSNTAIKNKIIATAVRLPYSTSEANYDYGYGRIDALAAVESSMNPDVAAPVITHTPAASAAFGQEITITAKVTDETILTPTAVLKYRNLYNVWTTGAMTAETGSTTYTGKILASDVKSNLDYYIYAYDLAGNTSYSPAGAPASYNTISITSRDEIAVSGNQTCPNPFAAGSSTATFSYYLSKPADVTVRVFSMSGEIVKTFTQSGSLGYNDFTWNGVLESGETAANGVYLYQIIARDAGGGVSTAKGKMIVLK